MSSVYEILNLKKRFQYSVYISAHVILYCLSASISSFQKELPNLPRVFRCVLPDKQFLHSRTPAYE